MYADPGQILEFWPAVWFYPHKNRKIRSVREHCEDPVKFNGDGRNSVHCTVSRSDFSQTPKQKLHDDARADANPYGRLHFGQGCMLGAEDHQTASAVTAESPNKSNTL